MNLKDKSEKPIEVLVDSADKAPKLPEFDDSLPCPKCDSHEWIDTSFGLAGGGFGPYTYCSECAVIVSKTCEPIDE